MDNAVIQSSGSKYKDKVGYTCVQGFEMRVSMIWYFSPKCLSSTEISLFLNNLKINGGCVIFFHVPIPARSPNPAGSHITPVNLI